MSILIPNRQMPKTCEECLLNYECDCRVAPNYNSADWETFLVAENGRREDCPLIELPPHGRWTHKVMVHESGIKANGISCSICGATYNISITLPDMDDMALNFCPNCGADMRESEVDDG